MVSRHPLFESILAHSPPQLVLEAFNTTPAVLAFHETMDAGKLRTQLAFVAKHRRVLRPGEFLDSLEDLPPKSILLTFDDGDVSFYERAAPVLLELGLSAVAFVVPGAVSEGLPYWWDVVHSACREGVRLPGLPPSESGLLAMAKKLPDGERRDLVARLSDELGDRSPKVRHMSLEQMHEVRRSGIHIGNHTWSHPILTRCDGPVIEEEISRAHDWIKHEFETPEFFAFPNGDADTRGTALLSSLGYRAAFVFDHRHLDETRPTLELSRLRITAGASLDRTRLVLSGLQGNAMRFRDAIRGVTP